MQSLFFEGWNRLDGQTTGDGIGTRIHSVGYVLVQQVGGTLSVAEKGRT